MFKKLSKGLLLSSFILILASSQLLAADSARELKSQKDKESYSIGYQVGQSMKTDGVEVDFEMLIQGLQDSINEKEPLLTYDEMKNLIVTLKKSAREAQIKKMQEQNIVNEKEANAFLEENKTKDGVMTTESGLQYKVLKKGDGISPGPEDSVTVNYRGKFLDGTEFDSSYANGKPATFKVKGVIRGWTEALQLMKTGSRWEIYIPPDLAYGRRGAPPTIQPNKLIVFEVELLSVEKNKDMPKESAAMKSGTGLRKMNLTGQIVKSKQGYIIRSRRGDVQSEVYTIRNPEPGILDSFVKSEKVVPIEVQIISGDNVTIERIDGNEYMSQAL